MVLATRLNLKRSMTTNSDNRGSFLSPTAENRLRDDYGGNVRSGVVSMASQGRLLDKYKHASSLLPSLDRKGTHTKSKGQISINRKS